MLPLAPRAASLAGVQLTAVPAVPGPPNKRHAHHPAQVVQEGLTWTVAAPGGVRVVAAQLQHRIPCWGYVFEEPAQRVPPPAGRGAGSNSSSNGSGRSGSAEQSVVAGGAEQHSGEEAWVRRGRKLVVLGDTCDSRAIARAAHGCDIISHEATYMRGERRRAGRPGGLLVGSSCSGAGRAVVRAGGRARREQHASEACCLLSGPAPPPALSLTH